MEAVAFDDDVRGFDACIAAQREAASEVRQRREAMRVVSGAGGYRSRLRRRSKLQPRFKVVDDGSNDKSVLSDPLYRELSLKYWNNPVKFAVQACGLEPSPQQLDLLDGVGPPGSRVSVSSGHGTGKSHMTAAIIWWHLIVYPNSQLMITANNLDQIKNVLWKYLKEVWTEIVKRNPWLKEYFELSATRAYAKGHKENWFVFGKTARPGHEESLAGQHGKWYMVIVDEASGVSDKALGVMRGALTESRNRMLMLSQPTRPSGFFYDSQHSLAIDPTDPSDDDDVKWLSLQFSSEESPWVTLKFLREKLLEYGGRDSPEYQIKVLGIFPDNMDGYLLSRADMETAASRMVEHLGNVGFIATADVAQGVERDNCVLSIWKVSGWGKEKILEQLECEIYPGSTDPDSFALQINDYLLSRKADYPDIQVGVDYYGPGFQTINRLEALGNFPVIKLKWGQPCFSSQEKERFLNKRAMAHIYARDGVREGRVKLLPKKRLMDEGAKIPCGLNERGQWWMMKKVEMASKGLKSPDVFDTVCFAYLMDHTVADFVDGGEEEDDFAGHEAMMAELMGR